MAVDVPGAAPALVAAACAAAAQAGAGAEPSAAGHRFWELSGGIIRCAGCKRVLISRKRSKKKGGRRYEYFYHHCSGYDKYGLKGCDKARFTSATLLEGQVWEFVRGILTPYKVPRRIFVVDELPKSLIGKVLRRQVRDSLLQLTTGS